MTIIGLALPCSCELTRPNSPLWQLFKCSPPTPRDQSAFEQDERIDVFISTADAGFLSAHFASKGVSFVVPLRQTPYVAEFYLRDPDGHVLGFVQSASA